MKKVLLLVLVSMILLFVFTSCDKLPASVTGKLEEIKVQVGLHEHTWADATCTAPKTCTNAACGATEGAALGHSWTAADCEHAKTCSVCNATEGEALGHNFADATCYEPKTCTVCNKTQGIALVHNWVPATCTDPKTCLRCELTEGEALGHDWADATCTKPQTCNNCGETQGEALGHNIIAADCTNPMHCDRCGATGGSPLGHVYTYECDAWCARCGELTNEEAAHKLTHVDAVAPTCFENGNVEYWTCEYCGGCWDNENATGAPLNAKSVIIPASHQDVIHVPAAEGTCVVAGNKEYWYCSVCELVWEDEALTMQSNHKNVKTDYNFNDHKLTCTIGDGAATYTCSVCKHSYTVDTGVIFTGTEENKFTYNSNGDMLLTQKDGIYEVFFNPEKPMPEVDGTTTAEVKDGWSWYNAWGAQHMFWIPSNAANKGVQGFSCANNATGFISFKMQTNVTNPFNVAVAKERNAADWTNWGGSQIEFLSIGGYSEDGIVIKAFGTPLATIPVADGWSEWFQLDIYVQLKSDNTYTMNFYVNGEFCLSAADRDMTIDSFDIRALYINGWTYAAQTGIRLDDVVFAYATEAHNVFDGNGHFVTEPTCTEAGSCSCGYVLPALGHDVTLKCLEDVKCSRCDYVEVATGHDLVVDGTTVSCAKCKNSYNIDNGVNFTGETDFYYAKNGDILLTKTESGIYEAYFNPEKPMPEVDGTSDTEVKDGWSWYHAWGAQHMFWIPSNDKGKGVQGFSCANNSVGLISFKMQTNVTNAFDIAVAKERGAADWSGWGTSQLVFLNVGGYSEDGIVIKAFGTPIATIPVVDGWSEWFQLDVLVQLKSNNTYTFEYYVNGKFCLSAADRTMPIDSGDIRALYISGWTYATQTGLRLDDIVFGSSVGGHYVFDGKDHKVTEGEYFDTCSCGWSSSAVASSVLAAEDVKSATLKTLVAGKIKQCEQSTVVNGEGGTPAYVLAEKDGELVEGLYFSRTTAWGSPSENKQEFTEFRFAVNGEKAGPAATKISFDYKINGTVEKNPGQHVYEGETLVQKGFTFKDLAGNSFVADAYVQIKTPSTHALAGDNYPELSGTDLVLDGEWHTMTYTFDEPLVIIDILLNLYHFQGEMVISNLVITYAE